MGTDDEGREPRHDQTARHPHAHDHGHAHGTSHAHDHGHAHGPGGHVHAPASFGAAFAVGIALNAGFVVAEAAFGVLSNSVALLADAGHNLSDVLGLAVAWTAAVLARRVPTRRFTYGLRGSSILAALFNAVVLLVAVGGIAWEAVLRLLAPEPVAGMTVMAVAAAGIAVNGFTAWLFARGRAGDLNIRGAYLHMMSDAAISLGVVVAAFVIWSSGWAWLDPLVSLAIVVAVVWATWALLRDSIALSMAAVPAGIDPDAIGRLLDAAPGVASVHDLHIWAMSTTEVALTAHLVMPAGHPGDASLRALADELAQCYGIGHATLQVETDDACPLAPADVV